jgi:hypothetical protein
MEMMMVEILIVNWSFHLPRKSPMTLSPLTFP